MNVLQHKHIKRRKQSWRNDENGVTAIEFALIAPVFLFIMMGIVEFSLIMLTSFVMEGATNITSRLGKTGFVAENTTRQEQIVKSIKDRTAGLLDPEKIHITTEVYSNFENIGKAEPCITSSPCSGAAGVNFVDVNGNGTWDSDMGAAGLGNAGDVVVYTVSYAWPLITPMISTFLGGNTFDISARAVVRNEPYAY